MSENIFNGGDGPEPLVKPTKVATFNEDVSSGEVAVTVPQRPDDQLRRLTLMGLFGLIILGLLSIVIGEAAKWVTDDLANTLIQTVISPILGALTAIIGYLFAERKP